MYSQLKRGETESIYSLILRGQNDVLLKFVKCEVSLTVVSAGSSVIDAWPLTRAVQDTMQVPHTHDRPVVQVILFIYLFIYLLIYLFIYRVRQLCCQYQYNCTRNVLWSQVHSSHIHDNHRASLDYKNSKQTSR